MGADGVELDVQTTADGAFVIYHDPHIGSCSIPHSSFHRVRSYRLPNGEPLPSLEESLAILGSGLTVYVEVKTLPPERDQDFFRALSAGPAPERCHIHAFDHRIVKRLREHQPDRVYGALSSSYPVEPLQQLRDAGATELWQGEDLIDRDLVERVHEAGARVYAWTVDSVPRMHELIDFGTDGLCTNTPDVARLVVERR